MLIQSCCNAFFVAVYLIPRVFVAAKSTPPMKRRPFEPASLQISFAKEMATVFVVLQASPKRVQVHIKDGSGQTHLLINTYALKDISENKSNMYDRRKSARTADSSGRDSSRVWELCSQESLCVWIQETLSITCCMDTRYKLDIQDTYCVLVSYPVDFTSRVFWNSGYCT